MMKFLSFSYFIIWVCLLTSCTTYVVDEVSVTDTVTSDPVPEVAFTFDGNGRKLEGQVLSALYTKVIVSDSMCRMAESLKKTHSSEWHAYLNHQEKYLSRKRINFRISETDSVTSEDQVAVIDLMRHWLNNPSLNFCETFDLYQIKGGDSLGNVLYTGYYLPEIEGRLKKDSVFKYPVYKKPEWRGQMPSRREIDTEGALADSAEVILYTSSLLDNYFLQIQGSGYVKLDSGEEVFLGYAGRNGHPYKGIGAYFIKNRYLRKKSISMNAIRDWFEEHPDSIHKILNLNPSYVFFEPRSRAPSGSLGTPLISEFSVAVDPDYIPYNTLLMGLFPQTGRHYKCTGHKLMLMSGHDTGGAINGPGHIDFFFGKGKAAGMRAGTLHHYGQLFLIMPKEGQDVGLERGLI